MKKMAVECLNGNWAHHWSRRVCVYTRGMLQYLTALNRTNQLKVEILNILSFWCIYRQILHKSHGINQSINHSQTIVYSQQPNHHDNAATLAGWIKQENGRLVVPNNITSWIHIRLYVAAHRCRSKNTICGKVERYNYYLFWIFVMFLLCHDADNNDRTQLLILAVLHL